MSTPDRGRSEDGTPWHRRHLLLESEISWLLLLSILDVLLTWALLYQEPRFVEANPVAEWFFRQYNVPGLVAYKFVLIAGVVTIAEVVERVQAGRGRLVLRIGIVAAAMVVLYSVSLWVRHLT